MRVAHGVAVGCFPPLFTFSGGGRREMGVGGDAGASSFQSVSPPPRPLAVVTV